MSSPADLERELMAFGATLERETAGPITPVRSPQHTGESGSRPWARVLVGVASMLMVVLAGVLVVGRDSEPGVDPADPAVVEPTPIPTSIEIEDRYPYAPNGQMVFPSPDGRWYLDDEGCVGAVVVDATPVCADDVRLVKYATWAADSSRVAFDEAAFQLGGGSDIRLATIENQDAEPATAPSVRFDNLTADPAREPDAVLSVLPLFVGDQIRFLRLTDPQPDSLFELVTIDLDGNVEATVDTELAVSDLAGLDTALVDEHHVVITRDSANRYEIVTIAADGTVESQGLVDGVLAPVVYGGSDHAAVIAVDFDADPPTGQVSVFDGTSVSTTGLPVTADDVLDPQAVDFSPEGTRVVAAYSSGATGSITLRVRDSATSTVTDIGELPAGPVRALRWVDDGRVIIFADDEIIEVAIR